MDTQSGVLPNFLLIGAQKCGTTWMAQMLEQHPQIATASTKELHFFSNRQNFSRGTQWYRQQFRHKAGAQAVGEFTPNYFWTSTDPAEMQESDSQPDIAATVRKTLGEIPLIVMLRDPVDRAVAAYYHHIRAGRVRPDQSILDVADRYGITSMGLYDRHFESWFRHFPKDRFLVLVRETDMRPENRLETVQRAFAHIGVRVDHDVEQLHRISNARDSALQLRLRHSSFRFLARRKLMALIPGSIKHHPRFAITVSEDERDAMRERFTDSIKRTEELLGRSLPWQEAIHESAADRQVVSSD